MPQKKYTDEFKEMIIELRKSGKPPCETIREYGLSSSAYYSWVNATKTVTVDDQKFTAKEVKALKRQVADLKEEVAILKKSFDLIRKKMTSAELSFLSDSLRPSFSAKKICSVFNVKKSTFYISSSTASQNRNGSISSTRLFPKECNGCKTRRLPNKTQIR